MVRLGASTGEELLSGRRENVMSDHEGRVVLGSRNGMPNPDVSDFDEQGRLEGWQLGAPDRPDGYFDFGRRLTRISRGAQGDPPAGRHVPLRNTRLAKQGEAKMGLDRPFRNYRFPLVPGSPIPAPEKRAKIAPPSEAPVVRVVTGGGPEGFPKGDLTVSYAFILGDRPAHSMRITDAAPHINVAVDQGNRLEMVVPQEIAENVTGIAWLVARGANNPGALTLQERQNLENRRRETFVLEGPLRVDRLRVTRGGDNRTENRYEDHPAPRNWREPSRGDLEVMTTRLSYRLRFEGGVSASQHENAVEIHRRHEGEALAWAPPRQLGTRAASATGWIPEFEGADGRTYVLPARSLRRHAEITSNDPATFGKMPAGERPRPAERTRTDTSGVPGPDVPLDAPEVVGAVRHPPGRYLWRQTFASGEEESGPGPYRAVTLRDSGLARGQAATGVSDQFFRVYRPKPAGLREAIRNGRFTERDPADDLELDWHKPAVPGVVVNTGDGVMTVNDTSGAADAADVRLSEPEEIDPDARLPVRFRLEVTRRAGGAVAAQLRFFAAGSPDEDGNPQAGAPIAERVDLERVSSVDAERVEGWLGPRGSRSDWIRPAGARFAQLVFRNVGTPQSPRNLAYRVSHIGNAFFPKRWPPDGDLGNDRDLPDRRSAAAEDERLPYPNGPFCRVVTDPGEADGARRKSAEVLAQAGFENNLIPGAFSLALGSGTTANVTAGAAISGDRGLKIEKAAGSASQGGAHLAGNFAGRRSLGWLLSYRLPEPALSGTQTLLEVLNGAGASLARLTHNPAAETLVLTAKNGAAGAETQVVAATNVRKGNRLRLEVVPRGIGGEAGGGRLELNWRRNDRRMPRAVLAGLDWSGEAIGEARAGYWGVPAAEGALVMVDGLLATAAGENETEALPGGYVEYWAPEGTPPSHENFMTGMKKPVGPNQDRVLSAYLGTQNVLDPGGASPLRTVVRDAAGRVLLRNPPLAGEAGLKGDNDWERHWIRYRTPPRAAYLEFVGGPVADGLIRAMAFQDEEGTEPTPFTNENALEGFFDTLLRTSTPGGTIGVVGEAERWVRVRAVATKEEDGAGGPLTGVSQEVRAADSPGALDLAPWRSSAAAEVLAAEGMREFAEIRTRLWSLDPTKSPEVRRVFLDLERMENVFLAADGSEYPSGCLVTNLGVPEEVDTVVEKEFSDGSLGAEDVARGNPPLVFEGFTLTCFRDSTRRRIRSNEERMLGNTIQAWGKSYAVRLLAPPAFAVERRGHEEAPEDPADGFHAHVATGCRAVVLSEGEI